MSRSAPSEHSTEHEHLTPPNTTPTALGELQLLSQLKQLDLMGYAQALIQGEGIEDLQTLMSLRYVLVPLLVPLLVPYHSCTASFTNV